MGDGALGAEWSFGDPTDDEVDGLGLLWRLHTHAVTERLPRDRTIVHVQLTGLGGVDGWLDVADHEVTVCRDDPGRDVHLAVQADTRQMQRWLLGLVPFRALVQRGHARLLGPGQLARQFPTWFDTGMFSESLQRGRRRQELELGRAAS